MGIEIVLLLWQNIHLKALLRQRMINYLRRYTSLEIGDKAPDFRIRILGGETFHLSKLRGSGALLLFFSTRCPACDLELEFWREIYAEITGLSGIEVLGVCRDNPDSTRIYVTAHQLPFKVAADPSLEVFELYRVRMVPQAYLIGPEGTIQVKVTGARNRSERRQLQSAIKKIREEILGQ